MAPPYKHPHKAVQERDGEIAVVVDKRTLFHECDQEAIIVAPLKKSKAEERRGRAQHLERVVKVQREPEVHERRTTPAPHRQQATTGHHERPKGGYVYGIRGVRFGGDSSRLRVAVPRRDESALGVSKRGSGRSHHVRARKTATDLRHTSNPLARNQRTDRTSAGETGDEEEGEPSHSLPAQGTMAPKSRTSKT